MNHFSMTQRNKPPAPPKKSRPSDAAFNIWLTRGLHEMYDEIASEPIPEDLLKLIEEDQKK